MKLKIVLALVLLAEMVALFACSTPASSPVSAPQEEPPMLSFSHESGIYTQSFSLDIKCREEGLVLRYTRDGSIPTKSSRELTRALYVDFDNVGEDKVSVVAIRAAAFDVEGTIRGEVYTNSYILCLKPEERFSTPIISLTTDPDNLYGYENGILVEGKRRDDYNAARRSQRTQVADANFFITGPEGERPINFEYFETDGTRQINQGAGVRVSGGLTRNGLQMSLRLFARKMYTDGKEGMFEYDFFDGLRSPFDLPMDEYNSVILRCGSNNFWDNTINTPFLMNVAQDSGPDIMNYRPVAVYINGSYYGMLMLMEDYSPAYFETSYGIPKEEITCLSSNVTLDVEFQWLLDNGPQSDYDEWMRMRDFIIDDDMSKGENYDQVCEMLDIDNFIRYMAYQMYIANFDWPHNNLRVWRRTMDGYDPDAPEGWDGRWRFLLKDLDFGFGWNAESKENPYARVMGDDGLLRINAMFTSLMKNEDFKTSFVLYVYDMVQTTVQKNRVLEKLAEVMLSSGGELSYHMKKYGIQDGNMRSWDKTLDAMRAFAADRPDYMLKYTLARAKGSMQTTLTVFQPEHGSLKINTRALSPSDYRSGKITIKYPSDLRIPLVTKPDEGYIFSHYEIEGGRLFKDEYLILDKETSLKAIFVPDESYIPAEKGLVINEVKFSHTLENPGEDWVEVYNSSDEDIYLKGYTLSDDPADPTKWFFPSVVLKPGEFLSVRCNGVETRRPVSELSADIKLSEGETLYLYSNTKKELDSVFLSTYFDAFHKGRYPDGGEWRVMDTPTMGGANFLKSYTEVPDKAVLGAVMVNGTRFTSDTFMVKDGVRWVSVDNMKKMYGLEGEVSGTTCPLSGKTVDLIFSTKTGKGRYNDKSVELKVMQADGVDYVSLASIIATFDGYRNTYVPEWDSWVCGRG
ncbi:MAG: CotH kinase family protein [Eubacteriales bacterium]